jgi:hypothetical protein
MLNRLKLVLCSSCMNFSCMDQLEYASNSVRDDDKDLAYFHAAFDLANVCTGTIHLLLGPGET